MAIVRLQFTKHIATYNNLHNRQQTAWRMKTISASLVFVLSASWFNLWKF